jgi:beta-glucosidase
VTKGKCLQMSVDVANVGLRSGDEVVQLYITDRLATVAVPLRQLAGFERVNLKPGQVKTVRFTVRPQQLACVMDDGERVIEPGVFDFTIGGGQAGYPPNSNVLTGQFEVR